MSQNEYRVVRVCHYEMACLIVEVLTGKPRPAGGTPESCLKGLGPVLEERFLDAADAVYLYMLRQLNSQGEFVSELWGRNRKDKTGGDVH